MKMALALVLVVTLSACGGPMSLLTGGGPNVAANVQAGKTNSQTVGQSYVTEQKLVRPQARTIEQSTGEVGVRAEEVGNVHVTNVDPWVLAVMMLLAGFLIPSPTEIAKTIRGWFSRKPKES